MSTAAQTFPPFGNGGPAFPQWEQKTPDGPVETPPGGGGMSLRDWFAGCALTGLLHGDRYENFRDVSKVEMGLEAAGPGAAVFISMVAFEIADRMIQMRGEPA